MAPPAGLLGWRRQFGHPTGLLGALVGRLMALKNQERSRFVLSLLDLHPDDRVLEIGFGPGADVERVLAVVKQGFVGGVDQSEVMVRQARRRNAAAVVAGRADLRLGAATTIPFPDDSFDKAFAINVVPFLGEATNAVLQETRRVLKPGGLVAVAVQPRSKGATAETARQAGAALVSAIETAGFTGVRVEWKEMRPVPTACVLGRK